MDKVFLHNATLLEERKASPQEILEVMTGHIFRSPATIGIYLIRS
jgi:hypothetical protein